MARRNGGRPASPVLALVMIDLAAIAVALLASRSWMASGILYGAGVAVVLLLAGLYRSKVTPRALDEVPRVLAASVVPLVALGAFLPSSDADLVALQSLATVPLLVGGRSLAHARLRRQRRKGAAEPTLVLGGGGVAAELVKVLEEHPELGMRTVGYLDASPTDLDAPFLGKMDDLIEVASRCEVRNILVAFTMERESELLQLLGTARSLDLAVYVVPRFFDLALHVDGDEAWGIPLQRLPA